MRTQVGAERCFRNNAHMIPPIIITFYLFSFFRLSPKIDWKVTPFRYLPPHRLYWRRISIFYVPQIHVHWRRKQKYLKLKKNVRLNLMFDSYAAHLPPIDGHNDWNGFGLWRNGGIVCVCTNGCSKWYKRLRVSVVAEWVHVCTGVCVNVSFNTPLM